MTFRSAAASLALLLALGACGSKSGDETLGNAALPSVAGKANVPAPDGRKWTEIVSETKDGGYLLGNPDAPVRLAEYGSFTCPHCREFGEESGADRAAMVDTGKLAFEYHSVVRDPLDMTMVLLARCGGKDLFFPLADQLFAAQTDTITRIQKVGEADYNTVMNKPINERFFAVAQLAGLVDFMKQRGISEDRTKQCLADGAQAEKIAKQVEADAAKYDIQGTPTLILNGTKVDTSSWTDIKAKLKGAGL